MNTTQDFTVKGAVYRAGRLDAFQQFHIARRLGPVMAALAGAASEAASPAVAGGSATEPGGLPAIDGLSDEAVTNLVAGPLAAAISELKQEDVDYILKTCLKAVERQQTNATGGIPFWAPVAPAGAIMFEDLRYDLSAMLELVTHVIQENLGSFFGTGGPPIPAPRPVAAPPLPVLAKA